MFRNTLIYFTSIIFLLICHLIVLVHLFLYLNLLLLKAPDPLTGRQDTNGSPMRPEGQVQMAAVKIKRNYNIRCINKVTS